VKQKKRRDETTAAALLHLPSNERRGGEAESSLPEHREARVAVKEAGKGRRQNPTGEKATNKGGAEGRIKMIAVRGIGAVN
jgi:hypothetical protein